MNEGTSKPEGLGTSALVHTLLLQMRKNGRDRGFRAQECQMWDQTPGLLVLRLRTLFTDSCCLSYWASVQMNFQLTE